MCARYRKSTAPSTGEEASRGLDRFSAARAAAAERFWERFNALGTTLLLSEPPGELRREAKTRAAEV
jgi:hypothetical protein